VNAPVKRVAPSGNLEITPGLMLSEKVLDAKLKVPPVRRLPVSRGPKVRLTVPISKPLGEPKTTGDRSNVRHQG
jgi:hypothetical protein